MPRGTASFVIRCGRQHTIPSRPYDGGVANNRRSDTICDLFQTQKGKTDTGNGHETGSRRNYPENQSAKKSKEQQDEAGDKVGSKSDLVSLDETCITATCSEEDGVLYIMEDGTEFTNFAQSLVKWAGVISSDSCSAATSGGDDADSESFTFLAPEAQETFWKAIRKSVRSAEENRPASTDAAGPPFECKSKARFGVSKEMAQINYLFSPSDFAAMFAKGGFSVDFQTATVAGA